MKRRFTAGFTLHHCARHHPRLVPAATQDPWTRQSA